MVPYRDTGSRPTSRQAAASQCQCLAQRTHNAAPSPRAPRRALQPSAPYPPRPPLLTCSVIASHLTWPPRAARYAASSCATRAE